MPQILPISTILNLASISQYLSAYDVTLDTALNGGSLNKSLPREIYQTRKNVEWMYAQDPTNQYLVEVGNYLYALCGRYISQAKTILGSNGGVVIPPSSSTNTYAFAEIPINVNGDSGQPIAGTSVYQNNLMIGAKDIYQITLDAQIYYNGVGFTFNAATGTITMLNYTFGSGTIGVITFNQLVN